MYTLQRRRVIRRRIAVSSFQNDRIESFAETCEIARIPSAITLSVNHETLVLPAKLVLLRKITHGARPRAVCDFAKKHQLRRQYKRLVVYGEGDGARYAGYLASLCEAFDTIILEGGDSDPSADYPSPLKRVHRLFLGYWHDHLTAYAVK